MGGKDSRPELLLGTRDLLIPRSLASGPMHGYRIAVRLCQVSEDVLRAGESSLGPALRLLAEFERLAGAKFKVLETS